MNILDFRKKSFSYHISIQVMRDRYTTGDSIRNALHSQVKN